MDERTDACMDAGLPAGFRFLGGNWVHWGGEHSIEDYYLYINGIIFLGGSSQFLVGRLPPPPPQKKKQASRKPWDGWTSGFPYNSTFYFPGLIY